MKLSTLFSAAILAGGACARYVMYVDEYHTVDLGNSTTNAGIDHAIMAFVPCSDFLTEEGGNFTLFEPIETFRARFDSGAKMMVAIGGWGDTNYTYGLQNDTMRQRFATNVKKMIDKYNLDGIDIDFEYVGGDGSDYRTDPNSSKTWEVEAFPLFLQAIRTAIGTNSTLSIAVPGLEEDMFAFTNVTMPAIVPLVDWFGVMTYDLLNRRSNFTWHHTPVQGSLQSVERYLNLGLPPQKAHLGFAFYAKYFATDANSGCATAPLGPHCQIVDLENADGSDDGESGTMTFTTFVNASDVTLTESPDGSCGTGTTYHCGASYCCSSSGYCGSSSDYCAMDSQPGYGVSPSPNALQSWANARAYEIKDPANGGSFYWDSTANLFWTWDTPEWIGDKFTDIVAAGKVGGVGAWSLGEDYGGWENVLAIQKGVKEYCLSEIVGFNSTGNCSSSG